MNIGHGRSCISPQQKEFYLIGYKSPKRHQPAKGIHDDIFCNGILLELEEERLLLISLDVLELEAAMVNEVKLRLSRQFQLNPDTILISATHDHSSVMSYHKHWQSGIFNQEYYEYLLEAIVDVCQQCLATLQPATGAIGTEVVMGFYSNRNHPGQLADNEVTVVEFRDAGGERLAAIVNLAVHSTVLPADNDLLTGDLAGQLCQKLAEHWGIFPLMMIGAAADSSNRHDRQGTDFAELERVTTGLAQRIAAIAVEEPVVLNQLVYQTLSHTIYTDLQEAHQAATAFLTSDSPLLNPGLIQKCQTLLAMPDFTLQLEFAVYDLGGLQLYAFPGELAGSFGAALKQTSREQGKHALVAGYTNDFHYYFMPKEEYGLSFETIGTEMPKGEPEKIIQKFRQAATLLAVLQERRPLP